MKKAIIIGASSGIGKELALKLADEGYDVGLTGRRQDLLQDIQQLRPDQFHIDVFDVTAPEFTTKLESLVADLGGLDLFIYSAGIGELNQNLAIELELPTIGVNVKAFNEAIVWAYKYFENQKKGHIVAISSIAGLRGGAFAPAYNASKAYQINYLEGLRQKVKKQRLNLTITDVRPGFVATDMMKSDVVFWVSSAEKAALQINDVIKAKKNVIYVTKRWSIIAGLLKILPRFLYERM
jgi:short-subunit dehydrogenase